MHFRKKTEDLKVKMKIYETDKKPRLGIVPERIRFRYVGFGRRFKKFHVKQ